MKLALAQMLVQPGEKQANLARAEERIGEAARRGADVVVLPEAMPLGWTHRPVIAVAPGVLLYAVAVSGVGAGGDMYGWRD